MNTLVTHLGSTIDGPPASQHDRLAAPPAAVTAGPAGQSLAMRKIVIMVAAAIVIFMAFSAYSVQKELQGSAQLTAIKDRYFPLLQRLDANVVRLDKIQELYIQVVITGDRDSIEKASRLGAEADQAFGEVAALYPGHEETVGRLRSDLRQYQDSAGKASVAYLSQDRAAAAPMAAKMNRALAEVESRLKAVRQSGYDEFVQTLAGSQRDAKLRLTMGLALGLMNLGFMGVLVFFIRNNMKMMGVIAEQNATLELRVAERTAQLSQKTSDINAMLQNMTLGVSTVVPGNRIHPEYSNYLRTIFAIDDVGGRDLIESLFGKSTLGSDAKDQIATALGAILDEDEMMFALNGHLLVREMHIDAGNGTHKTVQMDWVPIVGAGGSVEKVLLITQDVTHLRALEASSAEQKSELEIISRIIKISIGKFNSFVESAKGFIDANRRLINDNAAGDAGAVAALFRNMHTIKGNARTYELTHITNAAHEAEQTYDRMRKDENSPWNRVALLAELEAVETALARYVTVSEDTLGRKGRASDHFTARGAFVDNDQLTELRSMAAGLAATAPQEEIHRLQGMIDRLGLIPLRRIVSGSMDSVSSLAKELGKPAPAFEISASDIAFNSAFAEALKSCFMHITRNSLDHGIEAPAERLRAGKSERGTIRVACRREGEALELHIDDDGRGLALDRLYQAGLTRGLFAADAQPPRRVVADSIFVSGVSTSAGVSQISGRGVGMEAVRTFLAEQGASIRLGIEDPDGATLGLAPFSFIISIPASACQG
jgi:HPt (histidine-containing phosphotransfer) domain-containing protein